ncbi:MAG: glycosyltransferase family 4 protein, partial [Actinomycetota bacterium]|nr:glycosyltransferase family 4 protein [Actinomycetota bacterium]
MRVLMLSWEYPPLLVGGLGRHVEALARELVTAGHDVRVVTRGDGGTCVDEVRDGVPVRRAAVDPIAVDFTTESLLAWSQVAEHSLIRAVLPVISRWRPDVVHAHDWLVAQTGVTLSRVTGAPLVVTMHATEAGRHQGWLPRPLNLAIHSLERWLAHQADAVITCSTSMHEEVSRLFELPAQRVVVIPNGIDITRWRRPGAASRSTREPPQANAPLIVFAGRLVHEKGVQTLIDATPALRRAHPGLRLMVAGTGVHELELRARARRRRIARCIDWAGFVPEGELRRIFAAADVVVVPSMYEPFGMVALEVAAAGTPLVVAKTGGLQDLVDAGLTAGSFAPGDVAALTAAVLGVLADP